MRGLFQLFGESGRDFRGGPLPTVLAFQGWPGAIMALAVVSVS